MKHIYAPQDFIDMSFFWMIGAALQRRIYLQCEEKPLFCNQYVILVGDPAIGKGLAIDPIIDTLKYHKLHSTNHKPVFKQDPSTLTQEQRSLLEATAKVEATLDELMEKQKKTTVEPLLFPVSPDDCSYQDLVHAMATSIRRINVDPIPVLAPSGSYGHCSLCVGLSEMATLFKRQSEQALKFLLKAFDCGDYEYSTLSRGRDLVKKCCLSLLAGTTPSQIQDMLDDSIINDGWTSRCIFVYGDKRRFEAFRIKDFSEEQLAAKQKLLVHLKNLSKIFGRINYHPEVIEFLDDYFENGRGYRNEHPHLIPYYGRKNIHVPKLAVAFHFAENEIEFRDGKPVYDNTLKLRSVKLALSLLEHIETRMHMALCIRGKNPIAILADKILKELEYEKEISKKELLVKFWNDMPQGIISLDEALNHLMTIDRITHSDKSTSDQILYKKI